MGMLTMDWSLHTLRRNIHTVKHGENGANLLTMPGWDVLTLSARFRAGANDEYTAASGTITFATTTGMGR
jgi:hypothetical protein